MSISEKILSDLTFLENAIKEDRFSDAVWEKFKANMIGHAHRVREHENNSFPINNRPVINQGLKQKTHWGNAPVEMA